MFKSILFIIFIGLTPIVASATDFYYKTTSSGGNSGTSCADAWAYTDVTNGLGVAGKWAGDNNLHLCDVLTGTPGAAIITSQGAGTSGHPVTLTFESGAGLTATYWGGIGTGAIHIAHNYIVIDGGTNGYLQATANGTSLANHQTNDGIEVTQTAATGIEIKNLIIANLAVHDEGADNTGGESNAIRFTTSGGGNLIHNNTIHDTTSGIFMAVNATIDGDQIYSNYIYNRNEAINYAPICATCTVTGFVFRDNHIGNAQNWDDNTGPNAYHHDGLHVFNGGGSGVVSGAMVYNNLFDGTLGLHSTGYIFLEGPWTLAKVFNNLMAPSNGYVNDGLILFKGGTSGVAYNNTIVCSADGGSAIASSNSANNTVENNVIVSCETGMNIENAGGQSGLTLDYNDYYLTNQMVRPPDIIYAIPSTWAAWKSDTGYDAHSILTTPGFTAYVPTSSSNVYHTGVDLSGLSITPLNTSLNLVARGSGSPWTMGANDAIVSSPNYFILGFHTAILLALLLHGIWYTPKPKVQIEHTVELIKVLK